MLETFYVPMLERSLTYDRVAGYFSSAVLSHASAGFVKFCNSENPREKYELPKFRLIVGARLNPKDEQVVLWTENPALLEEEIEASLLKSIEEFSFGDEIDSFEKRRFQGLSWMLDKGILEIKVGAMYDPDTNELIPHNEAEFHSKFGIVSDGECKMYFGGSANETKRAWLDNYETIDVSRSWVGEESQQKISTYEKKFEQLWGDKRREKGLVIVDFPEAVKQNILDKFQPMDPSDIDEVSECKKRRLYITGEIGGMSEDWSKSYEDLDKWIHQTHAKDWFLDEKRADGIGILEMATGSGKTRTALSIIREAVDTQRIEKTVICVPKTLEEQWMEEIYEHYSEVSSISWWKSGRDDHVPFFRLPRRGSVLIVSHHFVPDLFAYANSNDGNYFEDTMLIVDEMHRLGSAKYKNSKLIEIMGEEEMVSVSGLDPDRCHPFKMRMGLSATPWSTYDETRNSFLAGNFVNGWKGSSLDDSSIEKLREEDRIFTFNLEDGIKKGILCEFDYIPLEYTPSEEDFKKRKEAFKKVGPDMPEWFGRVLAAAVFKASREKIPVFSKWLHEQNNQLQRSILFVEDTSFGRELNELLMREHDLIQFREFFQGEDINTLEVFAAGQLDFLIACDRISEGIDIKTVDTIVLFSCDNVRLQTIQRIGRALRTLSSNQKKRARVIDFYFEEEGKEESSDMERKEWLEGLSKIRRMR
ncbi:MAG: hypothetical protein CL889_04215 [Dehalococcoidia bacterium]|nr:hypothetical protein [Dehalococcoidia bacterium]